MANSGIYSNDKMAWWFARDGGKLPDVPKQVELILSDLCNMSCDFCAFRLEGYTNEDFAKGVELAKYGKNNPKRWIPRERALALVDEIKRAGVLGLQLTGGGEVTVHPHHEEIMVKALDVGLKCSLVSNGLKWSAALKSSILPRFEWVRVSIDAGTAETFARTRQTPIDAFDKVVQNTRSLAGWVRASKSSCVLGVGYVVTPENWREIIEGVAVAKSTGAAYVRMSAFFNPDDTKPFDSFWQEAKDMIVEAKARYDDESFCVIDLFGDRLQDLADGRPDFETCSYQHYTHFIGGDMRPYRCCVVSYSDHGRIAGGDYSKVAFDEFWASKERKKDMADFKAPSCVRCQFSDKNRRMQYLLSINPPHKEFP